MTIKEFVYDYFFPGRLEVCMAHVMTYDEIVAAAKNDRPIYEELRWPHVRQLRFDGVDFSADFHDYLLLEECNEEECLNYNWNYRCWDDVPTEEEMLNTPWKPDPYKKFLIK